LVADPVGQADRLIERGVRLADHAARPARLAELDQPVTADGIGMRQRRGDSGKRLLQVTGRVLPGALPDRPGGGLMRIRNGLRPVAERAGGQVVISELDDIGGAGGGDILQRGRDPGVQPRPGPPRRRP
jgi:hypothetical protein